MTENYIDLAFRFGKPTNHLRFNKGKLMQLWEIEDGVRGQGHIIKTQIWLEVKEQDCDQTEKKV